MKVVALVSGGKDSCFAMMRCIDFGHEIVALANLLPENDNVDELDSYMYQTVGHQFVEAYAQCMGLPLFRKRIQGKLRTSALSYTRTDGDEVEDLEVLLRAVKEKIPAVSAVSTGAIASDYQRLRVENVCSRLGLISLAYLWKQDQAQLLDHMVERGISAILVKVAAMGLHPDKHLGKQISEMRPVLSSLNLQYGCNVCGEGGEYETLTLDCPLFKNKRIVLDDFNVILHSAGSIAPVGILHPTEFHLEPKSDDACANGQVYWVEGDDCRVSVVSQSAYVTVTCWRRGHPVQASGSEISMLLDSVKSSLQRESLEWADVLYIHLYLRNMKDFADVNSIYAKHISELNCPAGVPSRSTIEVQLDNCDAGNVMVEVVAARDRTKQVLHVQSISCWAPSCIGPYSQATFHQGLLLMAGQIGLDPPTMVLVSGGASQEMVQAVQNCDAVAGYFGLSFRRSSIYITVYCCCSLSTSEIIQVENQLFSDKHDNIARRDPLVLFLLVSALPKGAKVEIEPLLLVHELEGDHIPMTPSSSFRYYKVPGRLCRAMLLVAEHTSTETQQIVDSSMEQLSSALQDSELSWKDILAFHAYFVPTKISFEALKMAFKHALPEPIWIPVHGVGADFNLTSLLAFKLVAHRYSPCCK